MSSFTWFAICWTPSRALSTSGGNFFFLSFEVGTSVEDTLSPARESREHGPEMPDLTDSFVGEMSNFLDSEFPFTLFIKMIKFKEKDLQVL